LGTLRTLCQPRKECGTPPLFITAPQHGSVC